jgi:hypothetical protein
VSQVEDLGLRCVPDHGRAAADAKERTEDEAPQAESV